MKDTRNDSKKVEVELGWDGLGVEPGWGETPTYKSNYLMQMNICMPTCAHG